jgi:ATP-dependent Clp protease ATP-binding subunit ClpA
MKTARATQRPTMRSVLRAFSHHAESLGHKEIEPEHFVLGLLDESDGGAIKALRHFGVNVEQTKRLLLERTAHESQ